MRLISEKSLVILSEIVTRILNKISFVSSLDIFFGIVSRNFSTNCFRKSSMAYFINSTGDCFRKNSGNTSNNLSKYSSRNFVQLFHHKCLFYIPEGIYPAIALKIPAGISLGMSDECFFFRVAFIISLRNLANGSCILIALEISSENLPKIYFEILTNVSSRSPQLFFVLEWF